ncbi:MAG: homoserine kinase [Gemmatimonadota bacterium]
MNRVTTFAPGCIGNVGPGLDILGMAVAGPGDRVTAERIPGGEIRITDPGHADLPHDPNQNTAGIAAREVIRKMGTSPIGIGLQVRKGLPLAGGQGGSAASAVAAAVAVNALLGGALGRDDLIECCLTAEETVAGRHFDNIAASLIGGVVLIRSMDPLDLVSLPVPPGLRVVMAHPDQRMSTRDGRMALPSAVPRSVALYQAAQVGALVAALSSGDLALLGRAIDDRIAEPARSPMLQGFSEAKAAAMAAGALGCSISGSGPTAFALVKDDDAGIRVSEAMTAAYRAAGLSCRTRVNEVDRLGARIETERPELPA